MNISYDAYRVFYYVAKYENFTRAARALYSSQPNVTRCIKNLEQELGCRLFVRSNRGVRLTPEGQTLFAHVAAAQEHLQAGEEALGREKSLQAGMVTVSASETVLHRDLLQVLQSYHRQYPHIRLRLFNHNTQQGLAAVKSGTADLMLSPFRVGGQQPLQEILQWESRDIMICGPELAFLAEKTVSLQDLQDYPLISMGRESKTFEIFSDFYRRHGLTMQPDIEVGSAIQLRVMVEMDLGIGFVPEIIAREELQQGKIFRIDLKETLPRRTLSIIKHGARPLSVAARELEQMLLHHRAAGL